jgi:hypothetical protein
MLRELANQDGNKNNIIDPQDNFQGNQASGRSIHSNIIKLHLVPVLKALQFG